MTQNRRNVEHLRRVVAEGELAPETVVECSAEEALESFWREVRESGAFDGHLCDGAVRHAIRRRACRTLNEALVAGRFRVRICARGDAGADHLEKVVVWWRREGSDYWRRRGWHSVEAAFAHATKLALGAAVDTRALAREGAEKKRRAAP